MRSKEALMIWGYIKQNRKRKLWRDLVRIIAVTVVFCTLYAMILPVITMEQGYVCGLEVHEHTDQCRVGPSAGTILCSTESLQIHKHTDGCYGQEGILQCGKADKLLHTHNGLCYGEDRSLICQLPRIEEHRHHTECFSGDAVICGKEELYPHIHGDGCYDDAGSLCCGTTEVLIHIHEDTCPILMAEDVIWGCGKEAHVHTDVCEEPTDPLPEETTLATDETISEPSESTTTDEIGSIDPTEPGAIETLVPPTDTDVGETEPTEADVLLPTVATEFVETTDLTETETSPEADPETDVKAGESTAPKPGYPVAVRTGDSYADTLYFFNFEATDSAVKPLAGCVFEIRGATTTGESYYATITSGNALEVPLPQDIPYGNYVITELSAPDGYLRDSNHTRSFRIGYSNTLKQKVFEGSSIGSFLNHALSDMDAGKTAEVENYNNRTYEIILQAEASIRLYEMEPIDVLFVVDQSNSMLFPSGLKDTGRSITLYQDPKNQFTGNQNVRQMNGFDRNQLYYIIADPTGTSTVFALWYNGSRWMYQDASYYAKAWHDNAEGYRQDNEIAAFPSANQAFQGSWTSNGNNYKANGGDLGYTLGGTLGTYIGDGSNKSFRVYTAVNEYNRLHYLEESITRALYQLSDANVKNTATLIRFTKEVDETHCMGPLELTPDNANTLVDAVNKIQTDGGTRQDLALEHAYNHLIGNITYKDGSRNDKYLKDVEHTFTILITDGAPVRSGSDAPSLDTIYSQIRSNGAKVRQQSTLVTIGLGMGDVEGGKQVLQEIASLPQYANMLEDASDLTELLHDLLFANLRPGQTNDLSGDIIDTISDSFYPIAWLPKGQGTQSGRKLLYSDNRDWVLLQVNDWITIDGRYVGPNRGNNGVGQLFLDEHGDYSIRWQNRTLSGANNWEGRFFVKAKEDFIGGNAIDTNKKATVMVGGTTVELPTPTVNVRLLDMNQRNSEVTVFLGDTINEIGDSPLDSLKYFYYNTRFMKLIADFPNSGGIDYGPIMNALDPDAADDGLEQGTFSLRYAMDGDLTDAQWEYLMASEDNRIYVDYTYDDASSHGSVGYFTFQLTKAGDTADYNSHEATLAGEHVEEYILHVTYRAYEPGESSILDSNDRRPSGNVHNGTAGPGTVVADENGGGLLENGYGIVDKDNVHIVNVISGSIQVTKEITPELVSDSEQIYRFFLHRMEDGDDHSRDRMMDVVIPPGETMASFRTDNLPRGTWVLTEQSGDTYNIRELTIIDTTNCASYGDESSATFRIGYCRNGDNAIGKMEGHRYTDYTGAPEGVFGEAKVVNEKTIYYGELPVRKIWGNRPPIESNAAVYVVLYRNVEGEEQLVLDSSGYARVLRLDAANGWQGKFRVALPEKGADVRDQSYFVLEIGEIANSYGSGQPAILENDGVTVLYYHIEARHEELLVINGTGYMVTYEVDDTTGEWTVTNHVAVTLPATGGPGTQLYTISGLLLIVAALIVGYSRRCKRERRSQM